MTRYSRCTLLALAALVVSGMVAAAEEVPAAGPNLSIPERVKDFGMVPQGDVLTTPTLASEPSSGGSAERHAAPRKHLPVRGG